MTEPWMDKTERQNFIVFFGGYSQSLAGSVPNSLVIVNDIYINWS